MSGVRFNLFSAFSLVLLVAVAVTAVAPRTASAALSSCPPTAEDEMGPFYRPGAPVRSQIGSGYLLQGTVRSANTCQSLPAARIEFWQAGPDGHYSDAYRATVIADREGRYRLETDAPPPYVSRPPHIHIRVEAEGFETLVTQHYLQGGEKKAVFDLVLVPKD